ncbi:MAG: hypothetical protein IPJ28_01980 [Betaproteobacteria bacterium]|nr:hypothetical protein [Betaproteobacteria bacterium]
MKLWIKLTGTTLVGILLGVPLGMVASGALAEKNREATVAAELYAARQALAQGRDQEVILRVAAALARDPSNYSALTMMATQLSSERASSIAMALLQEAKRSIEAKLPSVSSDEGAVLNHDLQVVEGHLKAIQK